MRCWGAPLDELAPQTRRLLEILDDDVATRATEGRMERAEVRSAAGSCGSPAPGATPSSGPPGPPGELEYLVVHRAERAGFSYELAWDGAGRDGSAFLVGLLDPAALDAATAYDPDRSGQNGSRSALGRPPVGAWLGAGRTGIEPMNGQVNGTITGNGNGSGPERTSRQDDDEVVVVEDGAERVAAEVAS